MRSDIEEMIEGVKVMREVMSKEELMNLEIGHSILYQKKLILTDS